MNPQNHPPLLSVVVVIVSDTTTARADASLLSDTLAALGTQQNPPPMEILVPHHPHVEGIADLRRRFPHVRFLSVTDLKTYTAQPGNREHHDELRARGLHAARGAIIALLEDHALPAPDWAMRLVEAHRQPYAAIGGAIENSVNRTLNHAVYLCDFYRYQNPVPEGESPFASDANVSYKRAALEAIRPVWQEIFHETAVHAALRARGEKLALSPRIVVHQNRRNLRWGDALQERWIWGRSYAATRTRLIGPGARFFYAALSPLLPPVLLLRICRSVAAKGRVSARFIQALPAMALLTLAWSWGELTGYLTQRAHASGAPAGEALARLPHQLTQGTKAK